MKPKEITQSCKHKPTVKQKEAKGGASYLASRSKAYGFCPKLTWTLPNSDQTHIWKIRTCATMIKRNCNVINMQCIIEQFVSSRRLQRRGNLALFTNLLESLSYASCFSLIIKESLCVYERGGERERESMLETVGYSELQTKSYQTQTNLLLSIK